jgi:hypothetical protein
MAALKDKPNLTKVPPMNSLYAILTADQARMKGDARKAVVILEAVADGGEPFQVHVALLEAYRAVGDQENALTQVRWLTGHRGRAYSELGCGWCQQPLNVADTTLARLRAAELLAAVGNKVEARKELQGFDSQWRPAGLPNHLRVRREAVLATFN